MKSKFHALLHCVVRHSFPRVDNVFFNATAYFCEKSDQSVRPSVLRTKIEVFRCDKTSLQEVSVHRSSVIFERPKGKLLSGINNE